MFRKIIFKTFSLTDLHYPAMKLGKTISMAVLCKSCGLIDDFRTEKKANNLCAFCNSCGKFIKNIPTDAPKFYVGKYKGEPIEQVNDLHYLKWAFDKMNALNERQRNAIQERIYQLETYLR